MNEMKYIFTGNIMNTSNLLLKVYETDNYVEVMNKHERKGIPKLEVYTWDTIPQLEESLLRNRYSCTSIHENGKLTSLTIPLSEGKTLRIARNNERVYVSVLHGNMLLWAASSCKDIAVTYKRTHGVLIANGVSVLLEERF